MRQHTVTAFLISFLLLVTVVVIDRANFVLMRDYTASVDSARQIITTLSQLSNDFKSVQIYSKKYATRMQSPFYNLYLQEAGKVTEDIVKAKKLIGNSVQIKRIDTISALINEHIRYAADKNIVEIIESGQQLRLNNLTTIQLLLNRAIAYEELLLEGRKRKLNRSARVTETLSLIFAVLAVSIILTTFIANYILARKRKWLETLLQSILNTSQNGVILYNEVANNDDTTDFEIGFYNPAVAKLLGLTKDNLAGKKLAELPAPEFRQRLFHYFILVMQDGRQQDFELYYDSGEPKWFYIMLARLDKGVLTTLYDITSIKQFEQELKTKIKELEESNSELEQYAYVASHDLQEPLRKILTYSDMLKLKETDNLSGIGQKYIAVIVQAASRMQNLIKDILNYSSTQRHELFALTDLNGVLHEVLSDLNLLISEKGAVISSSKLPVIQAIPLQINQLFYNLLHNALKFSRSETVPEIKLEAHKITAHEMHTYQILEPDKYIKLVVSDNGIGFNQQYAQQIFGLFKRLPSSNSGYGIGLSLCKKVVENHHGHIWAVSTEGHGTAFHIILPVSNG